MVICVYVFYLNQKLRGGGGLCLRSEPPTVKYLMSDCDRFTVKSNDKQHLHKILIGLDLNGCLSKEAAQINKMTNLFRAESHVWYLLNLLSCHGYI